MVEVRAWSFSVHVCVKDSCPITVGRSVSWCFITVQAISHRCDSRIGVSFESEWRGSERQRSRNVHRTGAKRNKESDPPPPPRATPLRGHPKQADAAF